jgi:hypothetical protein
MLESLVATISTSHLHGDAHEADGRHGSIVFKGSGLTSHCWRFSQFRWLGLEHLQNWET